MTADGVTDRTREIDEDGRRDGGQRERTRGTERGRGTAGALAMWPLQSELGFDPRVVLFGLLLGSKKSMPTGP